LLTDSLPELAAPSDPVGQRDDRAALIDALMRLSYGQRAAVVLRYWLGLTETEAAAVLGCSVGNVKSQAARGLAKLRTSAALLEGGLRKKEVSLTPVRYLGQRYVAIALPFGVPVVKAVAYNGTRELAYSVPYQGTHLDSWWRPGQAGPPRLTKTILAGVTGQRAWRVAAQFGPWGYCFTMPSDDACWLGGVPVSPARGDQVQALVCGGATFPAAKFASQVSLVVVSPDVDAVRIRLSGGAVERYTPVGVDGIHVLAVLVPHGQLIESSTAFGASGQLHGWLGSLGCL
jgi:hypothetical protein